jgi:flavin reductase (DIM6/NTAB) family NADH-FMN oxidoreductase RutF
VRGIDPATLAPRDRYRLGISAVVPRPIAWITTVDRAGVVNLAPFSYFNGVCAQPLILSVAIAHREPIKDTLANLRATGEAVVHLVPGEQLQAMHASSGEYRHELSEPALLGLELVASERVRPPRLAPAEVAFECRLHREIPVGDHPVALCLLEAVYVHVAESVAGADGIPDPARMRAVARLGGDGYLLPDGWNVVELKRPRVPPDQAARSS